MMILGKQIAVLCLFVVAVSVDHFAFGCESNADCEPGICFANISNSEGAASTASCFCPDGFSGSRCQETVAQETHMEKKILDLRESVNVSWLLVCSFMIFFASICFWGFGYGFGFGHRAEDSANGFIGDAGFFTIKATEYTHWMISWAFACVSVTIVSGSLAERCNLKSYALFSAAMASLIYPVCARWAWSEHGWASPAREDRILGTNGYIDFAGSGIVHVVGGFSGLVGAHLVGARLGRFDDSKKKIEGHSVTMASLGTLILWFGWYGFNPGSVGTITDGRSVIAARVATTTTLSATTGGLATLVLRKFITNTYDLPAVLNGLLGGLVSITGPCAVVEPWAAVVIGLSSFVYCGSVLLLEKIHIDDPLEASAVHGFCGMWGVISTGLFATQENISKVYFLGEKTQQYGLFYGGGGQQLGVQLLVLVCLIVWSSATSWVVFSLINRFVGLRVPREVEFEGLDRSEHGGHAYPEFEKIQFHGAGTGY